jgi:hypothetical protein
MAATFAWTQRYGTTPGTESSLGISGNLFNYKKADDATAANYSSNPITAGNKSYEVWLRAKFTGTFSKIDNLQFWRSTDFSPNTGLSIKWYPNGLSAYAAPTSGAAKCISAIPTSDPGTANLRVGAFSSLTASLAASGYSSYIVTQLNTTSAAAAGDTSLAAFTLNYDES